MNRIAAQRGLGIPIRVALLLFALGAGVASASGCFVSDRGRFPPPALNVLAPAPSWIGVPYEDFIARNSLGQIIHGWYMPAAGAKLTVLVHHGAITNRSSTANLYVLLHQMGCNVTVYDYQGFGENPNPPDLDSILPDADAALGWVQQRVGPEARIVLFGVSLGTLPAIAQAARPPAGVVGVVLEGSFLVEDLPPWSPLAAGIVPWVNVLDAMPAELNPAAHIGAVGLPKLFLQSSADLVTPFQSAQRLCDLAPSPKVFIEILGPHTWGVMSDPRYREHLETFFSGL